MRLAVAPRFTPPRGITWRLACVCALLLHGVLAAILFATELNTERRRDLVARQQAVQRHAPAYQRTAAETYAHRLRRIRELAERLEAAGRNASPAPAPTPPSSTLSTPAAPPPTLEELHTQSRRDYEATRERLLDLEAQRLATLTRQPLSTARAAVEARSPVPRPTDGAPGASRDPAAEIAQLHGDAQQLLARALQQQTARRNGAPLDLGAARAAYTLAQNQQNTRETQSFDAVVDWTALMGRPLSTTSVNGILDPEETFRRVETSREAELRRDFDASAGRPLFTRRIGTPGTEAAAWICPDAWYVIGPFENAHREGIDRTFPPEIEIDRDATYAGKSGRPVGWTYLPVHRVFVIPPQLEEYAVYYAFTEIYAAQPVDCWLAIGSDDHSKLWVNDHLVWSGTRNEKAWTPTEGFRRVRLDAGFNRLLFRLENGWREARFSLLLSPGP